MVRFRLLTEGGNIPGANSAVPSNLLDITIKNGLQLSSLKGLSYSIVGNKNKKFLGDVDIAVSAKDLVKKASLDPKKFWDDLDSFLKKQSKLKNYKVVKGFQQFHLVVPLVDSTGKHLSAIDKNGQTSSEKGFVQLDIFVGDREWMEQLLSGAPDDSDYKAVYRNLFLVDIFGALNFKTNDPDIKRKFQLDFKNGIKVVDFVQQAGKKKKVADKFISGNMDKVAQILFDPKVKWNNIDSFEKLYQRFSSNDFRYPEIRRDAIDRFKKTLKSAKLETPKEIR